MGKTIKGKVKAKAAAVKAKAKGIKSKAKCCASLLALLSLASLVGCMDTNPASRQTYATYGDIVVKIGEAATGNVVRVTIGDGAIASADSSGSTETQTATPTQDVKPQTDISVPVNKAGAAQSVGSVLGDAAAAAVKGLVSSSSSSSDCADGSCSTPSSKAASDCADGSCEYEE